MTEHFIETKYKGMRAKPRFKEKQGKEARTSKINAEKQIPQAGHGDSTPQ